MLFISCKIGSDQKWMLASWSNWGRREGKLLKFKSRLHRPKHRSCIWFTPVWTGYITVCLVILIQCRYWPTYTVSLLFIHISDRDRIQLLLFTTICWHLTRKCRVIASSISYSVDIKCYRLRQQGPLYTAKNCSTRKHSYIHNICWILILIRWLHHLWFQEYRTKARLKGFLVNRNSINFY